MLDPIKRGSYLFFDDDHGAFSESEFVLPPPVPEGDAQIGSQARLSYWHEIMLAYVDIPNVRQFGPTGATKAEASSTDGDSTGEERIGGVPDGDEFEIICVCNATTAALLKGFFDGALNIDLRITYPAPLTWIDYFSFTPLHFEKGTITPSGLVETTMSGRISGAISIDDPHS